MKAPKDTTSPHRDSLTPRQSEILALRLSGASLRQIEAKIGVDHATVARTLKLKKVKDKLDAELASRLSDASETLQARIDTCIDTLYQIAQGDIVGTSQQVRALQDLVDRAGLTVTQKHEVTSPLSSASDAELIARIDRLKAAHSVTPK
jgi:DNA-binding CsgD family transcriptional regulator